jgi:Tetracyclin repressor-like, C-terminal domain
MPADEAGDSADPAQRLAAMTRAYVRFAAGHRALFETCFGSGLDTRRHRGLERAYEAVDALFVPLVEEVYKADAEASEAPAGALEASAYGHTALLLDGEHGDGRDAVEAVARPAPGATLALIAGRDALRPR